MEQKSIKQQAKNYFLPFILGNCNDSRRLASRVFRQCGITSFVLDFKRSPINIFGFSYYFVELTATKSDRLLCEQLIDLAHQNPSVLPILVPASASYQRTIEENRELLERYFIISEPQRLLIDSPLASII